MSVKGDLGILTKTPFSVDSHQLIYDQAALCMASLEWSNQRAQSDWIQDKKGHSGHIVYLLDNHVRLSIMCVKVTEE